MNPRTIRFNFLNLFRQVIEVIDLVWRRLNFFDIVEIEILLRAVVGKVRGVNATCKKERFFVFLLELFHGPVDALSISHHLFFLVRNRSPFEKQSSGHLLITIVDTGRERIWKRCFLAPTIERPPGLPLNLVSQEKLSPVTHVNSPGWMVKQLSGAVSVVSSSRKARL